MILTQKTAPPRSGKYLEMLGSYNPQLKQVSLNKERILYWLERGAQCSATVHNLLVKGGVISGPKRKIKMPAAVVAEKPVEVAVAAIKKSAEISASDVQEATPIETAPLVEAKTEEAAV